MKPVNKKQMDKSRSVLGRDTVEMLLRVHDDALWILENREQYTNYL